MPRNQKLMISKFTLYIWQFVHNLHKLSIEVGFMHLRLCTAYGLNSNYCIQMFGIFNQHYYSIFNLYIHRAKHVICWTELKGNLQKWL